VRVARAAVLDAERTLKTAGVFEAPRLDGTFAQCQLVLLPLLIVLLALFLPHFMHFVNRRVGVLLSLLLDALPLVAFFVVATVGSSQRNTKEVVVVVVFVVVPVFVVATVANIFFRHLRRHNNRHHV
jgi:hypothetical protein